MTLDRTATVRPVPEHEATGKVAAIFADIKATKKIDFVPAIWRTLATNPVQLEVVWTTLKTLMHPEAMGRHSRLDPTTREIIALAVSATNGCPTASTPTRPLFANWASIKRPWARSWPSSASST